MKLTYRKNYQKPAYKVPTTHLDFTLDEEKTIVVATVQYQKLENKPLFLNGRDDLILLKIELDGKKLSQKEYKLTKEGLTIKNLPEKFELKITTQISPIKNTRLMGLYMSNGIFCTQCEPEGFRAITYFLDHPDVMSSYQVSIHANRKKYPILLSNGNKTKDEGDYVEFTDPFPKPSYLFALVAGDLGFIRDNFTTCSGRKVNLAIYCEKGKEKRIEYAMQALKRAMRWDEERFGREYDLDVFSIVAVPDFNAGAMENKSLNIFNDSCLLADQDTATDAVYEFIEGVVGHEYFHNWSGDRVTAKDWFNLSLKEGFTVYRDQTFTSDMRSATVKRIDDVDYLKTNQFPSDNGPLKHPVRPDSFATIENFYTTTIYEKGAELIRMQEKLVGWKGFRKGTDLYFSRHDGQAVSIDDFVKCIEDANQIDLKPFMNWYSIAGRPEVKVIKKYNSKTNTYSIKLKQKINGKKAVFMMPIDIGLIAPDGKEILAKTLIFNQKEQEFIFENITERPTLSINRGFTSPITLCINYSQKEIEHLITYDTDLFNRYEIGQEYMLKNLLKLIKGENVDTTKLLTIFSSYLEKWQRDPAFVARAITLPATAYIGEQLPIFDVDKVIEVRKNIRFLFAQRNADLLFEVYKTFAKNTEFDISAKSAGERALKNVALSYLSCLKEYENLAFEEYRLSNNMTDRMASLSALIHNDLPNKQKALEDFYKRYEKDSLTINKWLALQASVEKEETLDKVIELERTKEFSIKNPNKVRSLIGVFSHNLKAFHRLDGKGYQFIAEKTIELDRINPQIAQGIIQPLCDWKHFCKTRQDLMKAELNRILSVKNLSVNLEETIRKALK